MSKSNISAFIGSCNFAMGVVPGHYSVMLIFWVKFIVINY